MIKIVDNRGWQMTFPNGWTVSVVMGKGAYCDNKDDEELEFTDSKPSPNAEIAAWYGDSKDVRDWYLFDDDTVLGCQDHPDTAVLGWQKPLEILSFINMIANKDGPGESVQDKDKELLHP